VQSVVLGRLAQGRERSLVRVGPWNIGDRRIVLCAGPCAVEGREEMISLALSLKEAGAGILRGGAFKQRTSPYSFQGLGRDGLEILAEAGQAAALPVVTEVLDVRDLDVVMRYAAMVQVGSRSMQNYGLLKEVGRSGHPVLLKRGLAATIEEWLLAAEYILAEGNRQIVLCERGIRTFEPHTRNTMDIAAIAAVKGLSHLPVIADPSHASGRRELVAPLARAAVAAGADGLMIEVHADPAKALSDGQQSVTPEQLADLAAGLDRVAAAVGRSL